MSAIVWALAALVGALLWLLKGIAEALRDRVAERLAAWALPDDHPATFRIARGIALLASWLAPARVPRSSPDGSRWVMRTFAVTWVPSPWQSPAAAIAELEQDRRAGERIAHPVALTRPLLGKALKLRAWSLVVRIAVALDVAFATVLTLVAATPGAVVMILASPFVLAVWLVERGHARVTRADRAGGEQAQDRIAPADPPA